MKTGLTISALGHAGLLLWGLISFSARPLEAKPTESMPVDIISQSEFSQLTQGSKTAPKPEPKPPLVEKVGEKKPVKAPEAKVVEKPEIDASKAETPPPPPPEQKPAEAKPEKKPEPKVDQIAEALKKDEAKKKDEPKKDEPQKPEEPKKKAETKPTPPVPSPQKKPAPPQPKFDPNQISALLDKRTPQRMAATGDALNTTPGLGAPTANSARLSQNEIDAMRARLRSLWNVPAGARNPDELRVTVRVQFNRDGKLAGPPMVLTSGRGALYEAARDSAVRALFRGQPFEMLSPATYDVWKDMEITFDPREMF